MITAQVGERYIMVNRIYLAFYKGNRSGNGFEVWKSRLSDWLIRRLTKGKYSHCEIVIERRQWLSGNHYDHETIYDCYSSSIRDGGVRCKQIDVNNEKWDLIPLYGVPESQIKTYFEQTKGQKYDWCGALGVVFGINQHRNQFFCSEWCFNGLKQNDDGWRFSPNDLAVIFKGGKIQL